MIRKEICSLQIIVVLVALTGSLFLLSADALPLTRRTLPPHILTAIAGERWLPAIRNPSIRRSRVASLAIQANRHVSALGPLVRSPGYSAILHFCFGDVWLALAVAKAADASYQDFCREVQELTKDADVAALVRRSPEGSKGLYILLPTKCGPPK
jgi:hypothetical protein